VRKKDFVIPRVEEKKTRKYVSQNSEEEQKRKRDIHRSYSFEVAMNECDLHYGVDFGFPTFFWDFIGVRVSDSVVPFSVLLTFSMSASI
jgi:hypothetical protein